MMLNIKSTELDYYSYHHPFINPTVNPADILPVNGIPKFVIARETVAQDGHRYATANTWNLHNCI